MNFKIAEHFPNSKIRKRFFQQTVPLRDLLSEYGFVTGFPAPTCLILKRGDHEFGVVLKEEGVERIDQVLTVCKINDESLDYHVVANQLSGVIRTLVRWGGLGAGEIPEHKIGEALTRANIQCDNCGRRQPCAVLTPESKFKQCRLCKENTTVPDCAVSGFYCSKECQRVHWAVHREQMHV
jgi:hypothetical protein